MWSEIEGEDDVEDVGRYEGGDGQCSVVPKATVAISWYRWTVQAG